MKNKYQFSIIFLIISSLMFWGWLVVYGQQNRGTFQGIVVDMLTHQPLPNVIVKIQNTNVVVITNEKGKNIFIQKVIL